MASIPSVPPVDDYELKSCIFITVDDLSRRKEHAIKRLLPDKTTLSPLSAYVSISFIFFSKQTGQMPWLN
jgi:hypothetical protein